MSDQWTTDETDETLVVDEVIVDTDRGPVVEGEVTRRVTCTPAPRPTPLPSVATPTRRRTPMTRPTSSTRRSRSRPVRWTPTVTSSPPWTRSRPSRGRPGEQVRRLVRHPLVCRLREPREDQPRTRITSLNMEDTSSRSRSPWRRSPRSRVASASSCVASGCPDTSWCGWTSPMSRGAPCATPRRHRVRGQRPPAGAALSSTRSTR